MNAVELPREEVALLLGTLTACGFLILGVLELMWPTTPRRGAKHPARPPALRRTLAVPRAAALAPRPALVASRSALIGPRAALVAPQPALAPRQPASAVAPPVPAAPAPRPADAPRPNPVPVDVPRPTPPPPSPLEIARVLLERAASETDLERRVTILTRAVAGLTRSVQAAPDDDTLSQMLGSTRSLLWETWERIALARLAAAMPWNGEIVAAEVTPVLTRTR
jgi:hypothetical protein